MKVKLKDSIISELTSIGLRPGMVVSGTHVNKTTGAVDFTHYYNSGKYDCVVWPEDYEIVEDEKASATPEIADWVNQISTFFQVKPEKKPLKSGKGSWQFYNFRG